MGLCCSDWISPVPVEEIPSNDPSIDPSNELIVEERKEDVIKDTSNE